MKKIIQIIDAEDLYKILGEHRHFAKNVTGAYDLQALGWMIGTKDGIVPMGAVAETERQRVALIAWMFMIEAHLNDHPEDRRELGYGACVLVAVERDGLVRVVTWSERKHDCTRMPAFVDRLLGQVAIIPFRTVFGWGNGGVPSR